jgi:hypothetical protein
MSPELLLPVRVSGVLAIIGALIYAVGDAFLLAIRVNPADYPNLQSHAKLLSGGEE